MGMDDAVEFRCPTYFRVLEKGYHTILAGLQHIAKNPHTIGYDEVYTEK